VLGWTALEVASWLETSKASVNSALQRARATLEKRVSTEALEVTSAGDEALDEKQRALVERYIVAWESFDLQSFAATLREDAVLSMPPWCQWYRGRDAIQTFFAGAWGSPHYGGFHLVPTAANRQPACAVYSRAPGALEFRAHSIHVFTIHDNTIATLTAFINPQLFEAFGLPAVLRASSVLPSSLME
jgi:RNA polymerase sigma-70 factor (ECF subfamily)